MHFPFISELATFLERPNRFHVKARLHSTGEVISAHCPNPGRLRELLVPGATVHVSQADNPARKTLYDLRFAEHPDHGQLVSLDTRLPNALVAEGLAAGFLPPFCGSHSVEREVPLRHPALAGDQPVESRIDFRLVDGQGRLCWIEVKSVSLVEDGCALFPDAPTTRGRRHVEGLAQLVAYGERAAVVFVVQRQDASRLQPQRETDPHFAQALVAAAEQGVETYAYTCALTTTSAHLTKRIPVFLCI